MHRSVLQWVPQALTAVEVAGARVLEVGSYDVNGSIRPDIEALGPTWYVGVDQSEGPSVDRVVAAADLVEAFGAAAFDIVISCEMLEHVEDWQTTIARMVDVLDTDGLLVVTTRSDGFPYHAFPEDYWRYSTVGMAAILAAAGLKVVTVQPDPQAPGVFAKATKPEGWVAPWEKCPPSKVFGVVNGVTKVRRR